jgi:hypothetical protein
MCRLITIQSTHNRLSFCDLMDNDLIKTKHRNMKMKKVTVVETNKLQTNSVSQQDVDSFMNDLYLQLDQLDEEFEFTCEDDDSEEVDDEEFEFTEQ